MMGKSRLSGIIGQRDFALTGPEPAPSCTRKACTRRAARSGGVPHARGLSAALATRPPAPPAGEAQARQVQQEGMAVSRRPAILSVAQGYYRGRCVAPAAGRARSDRCSPAGGQLQRRAARSEEHTSELQSHLNLVCRLLLEKKKKHTTGLNTRENHSNPRTQSPASRCPPDEAL